jgi:hypothetical protein
VKELNDPKSRPVVLLMKETGLAASCIEQGLTSLRKANFSQKWLYYQAFFLLSIGIERLMKLIIIVKTLVDYDSFPNNNELKKHGHNIEELFKTICQNKQQKSCFMNENELYVLFVGFISNYASSNRYYNLDALSGHKQPNDPLHEWSKIQKLLIENYCKPKEFTPFEYLIIHSLDKKATYKYTDEGDRSISSAEAYFEASKYNEKVQGYSVLIFYKIIDYLVSILIYYANKKRMLPYFGEFFPLFQNEGITELKIRKRKNWNYITIVK